METLLVDERGIAEFRCPHCGFSRRFNAEPYRKQERRLQIKCRCGNFVEIQIKFPQKKELSLEESIDLWSQNTAPSVRSRVNPDLGVKKASSVASVQTSAEGKKRTPDVPYVPEHLELEHPSTPASRAAVEKPSVETQRDAARISSARKASAASRVAPQPPSPRSTVPPKPSAQAAPVTGNFVSSLRLQVNQDLDTRDLPKLEPKPFRRIVPPNTAALQVEHPNAPAPRRVRSSELLGLDTRNEAFEELPQAQNPLNGQCYVERTKELFSIFIQGSTGGSLSFDVALKAGRKNPEFVSGDGVTLLYRSESGKGLKRQPAKVESVQDGRIQCRIL